MHLTPRELDKLQLHAAGFVAQKRYARGLTLNYPETVALISAQILEFIRDGDSVAELMEKGKKLLGLHEVMPGISEMVHEVQVEGTFPDGTKLVTVHSPICNEWGEENLALYASGLTRTKRPESVYQEFKAGELIVADGELELNSGREKISLMVFHTGDRPVQVGSHYNFFEVNPALDFDRKAAFGFRLDIPSGTAVRFEPGERKEVSLVKIAGNQRVYGGNGFISGELSEENLANALEKARAAGFKMGASK